MNTFLPLLWEFRGCLHGVLPHFGASLAGYLTSRFSGRFSHFLPVVLVGVSRDFLDYVINNPYIGKKRIPSVCPIHPFAYTHRITTHGIYRFNRAFSYAFFMCLM